MARPGFFNQTVDIANETKNVSPEQLLSNTQLGFIEKKEKKSRLIRQIGKVSKKILRHTIGDGELGHLSLLRFKMIVMLKRLVDYSSDLPSKHYLSKKFISITKKQCIKVKGYEDRHPHSCTL